MAWRWLTARARRSPISSSCSFIPRRWRWTGAPRFLLSEALRGEGALLRNTRGERFMERYHPLLELAPRDVVARAIVSEMTSTGSPHVFLDLTHRGESFIRERFPRIYETCLRYGVNIGIEAAPVAPAAHYAMGGVRTDLDGRTNVPRLFAAGEAACTGVHGANRLASNSLLEGVVFGIRAGRAMRETARGGPARRSNCGRGELHGRAGAAKFSESPGRIAASYGRRKGSPEACAQLEALAPASPGRAEYAPGGAVDRALRGGAKREPRGAFPERLSTERRGFRKAFRGQPRHRRCISIG